MNRVRMCTKGAFVAIFIAIAMASFQFLPARADSAGQQIHVESSATYGDSTGNPYQATSNDVVVTIAIIGGVVVTPKETVVDPNTDAFTGNSVTKTFFVTNDGNTDDAFNMCSVTSKYADGTPAGSITSVSYAGQSGFVTSINPATDCSTGGSTPTSALIAVNQSLSVTVVVNTTTLSEAQAFEIKLGAVSTHPGQSVFDIGSAWALSVTPPSIIDPNNPGSQFLLMTANGLRTAVVKNGSVVTFSVQFGINGNPATNGLYFRDDLPVGLTYILGSLTLNNVPVVGALNKKPAATIASGQNLFFHIPGPIFAGTTNILSFQATVNTPTSSSLINMGALSVDGSTYIATSPVSVMTGIIDSVYDAYAGGSQPIAGATMRLVALDGSPVALSALLPEPPGNPNHLNPFVTQADGIYELGLQDTQLGTPGAPVHYTLYLKALNYDNRTIDLMIEPSPKNDGSYNLTMTSRDGLPMSSPGGFVLTNAPSMINEVGVYSFGNIPMFLSNGLTVHVTADRQVAQIGDRVVFTIDYQNNSSATLTAATIMNSLPPGFVYAPGTGRRNGAPFEPTSSGYDLSWNVVSIPSGKGEIQFASVVRPDAQDQATVTDRVLAQAQTVSGGIPVGASNSTTIQISAGSFSPTATALGIVLDQHGKGVAGVRIYLENGESVITDQKGLFSIPDLSPGDHVLRLDESSLPKGYAPFPGLWAYNDKHAMMQMLHQPMGAYLPYSMTFLVQASP